jgi:hypothetical protein
MNDLSNQASRGMIASILKDEDRTRLIVCCGFFIYAHWVTLNIDDTFESNGLPALALLTPSMAVVTALKGTVYI